MDLAKPESRNESDDHGGKKWHTALGKRRNDKTGKYAMRIISKSIGKLQKNGDSGEVQMKLKEVELSDFYLEGFEEAGIRERMPWEMDDEIVFRRTKKKIVGVAELSLDEVLLRRLKGEAAKIVKWVKVNKIGVTQDVVDEVHFIWKRNELAMLKFDVPLSRNMDRAREIVEVRLVFD